MNRLLAHYCIDVQHPEVSGAEHLAMLRLRDRLADIEPMLTTEEQDALVEADRALVTHAAAFVQEIQRFLNLEVYLGHQIFGEAQVMERPLHDRGGVLRLAAIACEALLRREAVTLSGLRVFFGVLCVRDHGILLCSVGGFAG
jgi:hypothetical protein